MTDLPAGGSRAALFLSSVRARMAPSARFWLIPAFLAFVVLVPLARNGLPVTQAGLLPLNKDVSEYLYRLPFDIQLGTFGEGIWVYKTLLVFTTLLSAVGVGVLARWTWKSQGWWVASLWLTLPLMVSLLYQRGVPFLALFPVSWFIIAQFLVKQVQWKNQRQIVRAAAFVIYILVFTTSYRLTALFPIWTPQPPLYVHQLFSGAWSPSDNWREWVGQPSYLMGVVPFGLGVLTALAAWPRRTDTIGRRVFILLGIAAVCIVLPLVAPTPVTLLLIAAAVCLVVAIGALPMLDTRYASFPIQLAILAIALLSVYPYLRPAWFEETPTTTTSVVVGDDELWLATLDARREDGNLVVEAQWQSAAVMSKEYTAFVHFLDDQNQIVAQSDALMVDSDNVTTTGWSPGYVVTQTYTIPDNAAITHIRYGVYDRETLERLPANNEGTPELVIQENAVILPITPTP